MKTRILIGLFLLVCLAAGLTRGVSAQDEQPPQEVTPPPFPFKPIPSQAGEAGAQEESALPAPVAQAQVALPLGASGTSYSYLKTLGTTETPYLSDTKHINYPWAIATDGNHLLVGEFFGHRLLTYSNTGTYISSIGHAGTAYYNGDIWGLSGIAVDAGVTWVADVIKGQVYSYDASGTYLGKFKSGTFKRPSGIAFDAAHNIYISDGGNLLTSDDSHQDVMIFDSGGNLLATLGVPDTPGSDVNSLHGPQQLAIMEDAANSRNWLFLADRGNNRVQVFQHAYTTATWTLRNIIDVPQRPTGMAVDGANHLLYVSSIWNGQVKVFDITNPAAPVLSTTINSGTGKGNTPFTYPAHLAVDSAGNLYVADFGNLRVQMFNSAHVYLRTFGTPGIPYLTNKTLLNSPSGVAIGTDGGIYVTEDEGQRLIKLSSSGSQQWVVGTAGVRNDFLPTPTNTNFANPTDVALDATGNVYVADQNENRVQIYTSKGKYFATLGDPNSTDDNFVFYRPVGLAIAPNGYIYVADPDRHRVQIFDGNRNYVATLGVTDASGTDNSHFNSPQDVAVDSNGWIYVADTGNQRVQIFNQNRNYSQTMGETGVCNNAFDHFCTPSRLLVGPNNLFFVADSGNYRIQVFGQGGAYLTTIGGASGNHTGQLRNPSGMALDKTGNLYVADNNNHRVQEYAPSVSGWIQSNLNGFGRRANPIITTLAPFANQLYAATYNSSSPITGAQLWRSSDGSTWNSARTDGLGDVNNVGIDNLIEFKGKLYAGTWNENAGGQILRSSDGTTWETVITGGFDAADNAEVMRLAVYKDYIYAATLSYSNAHGTEVWRSASGDAGDWNKVVDNGDGDPYNVGLITMEQFNGYLYGGVASFDYTNFVSHGCRIWRTDGTTWTTVVPDYLGNVNCTSISLTAFGDSLYAGIGISNPDGSSPGGQIWRCQAISGCDQPTDWTKVMSGGFGKLQNTGVPGLFTFGGQIYAATSNFTTGMEVWSSKDGKSWKQAGFGGFGDSNNATPYWDNNIAAFKYQLYIGTQNTANAGEIWQMKLAQYTPTLVSPLDLATLLDNQPAFTWNAVSINGVPVAKYTVQVGKDLAFKASVGSYTVPCGATATTCSYTPTVPLPPNQTLYWRVKIIQSGIVNPWSEAFMLHTANPPSVPLLLTPKNKILVPNFTPLLDWSDSSLPVGRTLDHYQVQLNTKADFTGTGTDTTTGTDSQYQTGTLDPNTTFYWRVRAYDTDGENSAWSTVFSFRTPLPAPLSLSVDGSHQTLRPTFSWNMPAYIAPLATGFSLQLFKGQNYEKSDKTLTVKCASMPCIYTMTTDLLKNQDYSWQVRANGTNGPGAWARPGSYYHAGNPPSIPKLLSPANKSTISSNPPTLQWAASTGTNLSYYIVEMCYKADFLLTYIDQKVSPTNFTPASPLTGSPIFYWRITACNSSDECSDWSTVWSFKVP